MPFGEVMYRCNAHYCFSVFRNRVVGLLTTLALMQLFLFSFYLNGLHSEAAVARNQVSAFQNDGSAGANSLEVESALGQRPLAINGGRSQAQAPERGLPEEEPDARDEPSPAAASVKGQGQVQLPGLGTLVVPNNLVNHLTDLLTDPSKSKAVGDAAKKALDSVLMGNKQDAIPLQLMAMAANAAKKMSPSSGNSADQAAMTKIGLNLLANAFNSNYKVKGSQLGRNSSSTTADDDAVAAGQPSSQSGPGDRRPVKESDTKKYADLAKMGLQLFSNGLANSDPSGKSAAVNGLLETAAQFVLQQPDGQEGGKKPLDAAMAKTAMGLLSNALGNQKMDPKMMLNVASMAAKMLQPSGQTGSDFYASLNLLNKLVPNAATLTAPSTGSRQPLAAKSRWNRSDDVYSDYVRHSVKRLNSAGSKATSNVGSKDAQPVVDTDFSFPLPREQIDSCRPSTDYVILVMSPVENFEHRQAARDTWIDELVQLNPDVKILFVVGRGRKGDVEASIRKESEENRDVIQADVPDSDRTLQTVAGLRWIQQNCPRAKQILKCEDDVYVNPSEMLKMINSQQDESALVGHRVEDANAHSAQDLKHIVDKKVWPWNEYPPFLLGGSYLIGKAALPHLLAAIQVTPILPVEDVYITGLCALRGQVKLIHHKSFFSEWLDEEADACTLSDLASWRTTGPKNVIDIWKLAQKIKNNGVKCTRTKRCAAKFMGLCLPLS